MKTSVEWLKEYSDINVDVNKLAERLTMTGSKVETIEQKGNNIKNVVVGKILEITKHPDADKLVVTKVDVGNEILFIKDWTDKDPSCLLFSFLFFVKNTISSFLNTIISSINTLMLQDA